MLESSRKKNNKYNYELTNFQTFKLFQTPKHRQIFKPSKFELLQTFKLSKFEGCQYSISRWTRADMARTRPKSACRDRMIWATDQHAPQQWLRHAQAQWTLGNESRVGAPPSLASNGLGSWATAAPRQAWAKAEPDHACPRPQSSWLGLLMTAMQHWRTPSKQLVLFVHQNWAW